MSKATSAAFNNNNTICPASRPLLAVPDRRRDAAAGSLQARRGVVNLTCQGNPVER
jgi:hypothetical protein